MTRGRPPKADRTQEADAALEQWLQDRTEVDVSKLTEQERKNVKEALGDSEYAIDTLA